MSNHLNLTIMIHVYTFGACPLTPRFPSIQNATQKIRSFKNALSNVIALSNPSLRNFKMDRFSGHMHLFLRSELKVMSPYSLRNIYGADNKYH